MLYSGALSMLSGYICRSSIWVTILGSDTIIICSMHGRHYRLPMQIQPKKCNCAGLQHQSYQLRPEFLVYMSCVAAHAVSGLLRILSQLRSVQLRGDCVDQCRG